MQKIGENKANVKRYTLFDKEVWDLFVKPGEVVELRTLGCRGKHSAWGGAWVSGKGIVSGYFDNHEDFCKALKVVRGIICKGVYFTPQVIDPRLIGRAYNRLIVTDVTTSDNSVLAYRWLPIDLDPERPSGISSSDTELQAAMTLREEAARWIIDNLQLPRPIKAMSGNGAHLLFRLPDMPVDSESTGFIKVVLNGLAERFNNDKVSIDTSVFNPARIWKAYGTTAAKGDPVPASKHREARPHRESYIDDLGEVG